MSHYTTAVLAAAARAIEAAKASQEISDHGIGVHLGNCRYSSALPVIDATFSVEEVATSLLFLAAGPVATLRTVTKTCNSSYWWKHQAERWGRQLGLSPYVSNGAFIVAAEWVGIRSRRYPNSPNAVYALKSLRDLQWGFDFDNPAWELQRNGHAMTARLYRTGTL